MPSTSARDAATLRGGAVGALTAALAVAGHGVGGGGHPTSAALTLLVLCCGGVGAVAGGVAGSHRGGRLSLVAALAGGQLAGHLALSTTLIHEHAGQGPRAVPMLAAHAAATLVCAALILAAEKLYGPITRVLRIVLRGPTPDPRPEPGRRTPPEPETLPHRLLHHALSRRGPPVTA
ncbi:hypothetical protein ACFWPA_02205 [Rhodococcus sp. NPDC058505]|uniref:hypothetical protein n=1 Tax=Rhodococcus sp. NPDC058505 TaxID=3346531 RepID=UPI00364CCF0C